VRRFWLQNVLLKNVSIVIISGLSDDDDKKADEQEKRDALKTGLTLVDEGAKDGTGNQAAFNKVIAAMDAAKANTNDPEKDPAKAQLIRNVINEARAFNAKMDEARIAAAQKYIDGVQKLMSDAERQKADDFVKREIDNEKQLAELPANQQPRPVRRENPGQNTILPGAGGPTAAPGGRQPATPGTPGAAPGRRQGVPAQPPTPTPATQGA
jgi:hypothetical protein